MKSLLIFVAFTAGLLAQLKDTGPRGIYQAASAPAACAVGDIWFKTGVTAGQNLFGCTATNTWTLMSGTATIVDDDGAGFLICTGTTTVTCGVDSSVAPSKTGSNTWTGVNTFAGATSTAPMKVGTSDPGSCVAGQFLFRSDTLRVKVCSATDTWIDAATNTVASGTSALGTSAISSGACATVVTTSATGTASTDTISWTPNASIKAVTGYTPLTAGGLSITQYPTTNNVNFDVCNWTASSITPGAVSLNWRVTR